MNEGIKIFFDSQIIYEHFYKLIFHYYKVTLTVS